MHEKTCRNCGENVQGLFCSNCGQPADTESLTWRSIVDSLISTFIGSNTFGIKGHNARYGIFYTLWSLVRRPGTVISEYISGHRNKYFDPISLLLLLSTFYVLVAALLDVETPVNLASADSGEEDPLFLEITGQISTLFTYYSLHPWVWHVLQLPFLALAMKWMLRKRSSMRYMEYLYIGIFMAILSTSFSTLLLPFRQHFLEVRANADIRLFDNILFPLTTFYKVWIIHELFRIGWLRALWYSICISAITLLFSIATAFALLMAFFLVFSLFHYDQLMADEVQVQAADSLKSAAGPVKQLF